MKKVSVLGAGMVGQAIIHDLAPDFEVTAYDRSADNLAAARRRTPRILTEAADLSDPAAIQRAVHAADWVVTAVPGFLGCRTLEAVIAAGRNVVDISFFPEDPFALDALAKSKGVAAVTDSGVAPGLSNILIKRETHNGPVTDAVCYVGGLPIARALPWQYKAPFSPIDVIEEYTRPARYRENGVMVTREPLTEPERIDIPQIGTLDAFLTDGCRTLLATTDIPNLKEKTLRYPGYLDLIKALADSGFFSETPIDVKGAQVAPRDLTAALLLPLWKLQPGEPECTAMRIETKGAAGHVVWDIFDREDPASGLSSMSRTTGFTAAAMLRLLAAGRIPAKGIIPPEDAASAPEPCDFLLGELRHRGISIERRML